MSKHTATKEGSSLDERLLNVGIVGAGVMGRAYADAISGTDLRWRARVGGVCDADLGRAQALAVRYGVAAFGDLAAMLETLSLDAVYLAVPDHLHAEPFITCMRHRVPCLVEKPLATTWADAVAMEAAAREAGVIAQVNFSNRFNPVFARMREAITAGDLGQVIGVNARLSNTIDYPVRMLRWAGQTTCGWFLLSHVFDLAEWLAGARATEVSATGVKGRLAAEGVDTYDLIHALVRYDTGLSGLYESAWVLPSSLPSPVDFKVEVVGSHGALYADTQDQMVHVATGEKQTFPGTLDWTQRRLSAFLDQILDGSVPNDQLRDGMHNTALLLGLHEAIEDGRPVRIDDAGARP
jgi:predicted dehydrogenase